MQIGFTEHIDLTLIILYAFWIFFFGLIVYLQRESRREGYPLEVEVTGKVHGDSALWTPKPKFWTLPEGGTKQAPQAEPNEPEFHGRRLSRLDGAPYEPTGNPLIEAFGPASYAMRDDIPDVTGYGDIKIVPLRSLDEMDVLDGDLDPRGLPVIARDGETVGSITDIWVDRSESVVRYYEIELDGVEGVAGGDDTVVAGGRRVLVPNTMVAIVNWRLFGQLPEPFVRVDSLTSEQFATVPVTQSPDQVTRLEEDRISAYYAGGQFFNREETAGGL